MAEFTKLIPSPDQQGVSRTTIISFTITGSIQINTLGASINGTTAISNGLFINGYSGNIAAGSGQYVVGIYPKAPSFLPRASEISVHLQVLDNLSSLVESDFSFYTTGYAVTPSPIPTTPTVIRSCDLAKPFFPPTDLGLRLVKDQGIGTEVKLEWESAYPNDENNVIFYNIYVSTERETVFDGYPDFFVEDNQAIISGLRPGDQYFFGVRVTEFNPSYTTTSGRSQVGLDLYRYYTTQVDGYINDQDMFIPTSSVEGFSDFGILLVGDELIRYSSKQNAPSGFTVAANGRGFAGSYAEAHWSGSLVRLYAGKEDGNTIRVQSTPTFQKPNLAITYTLGDGYGADGYRDGYDGYAFQDGYLRLRQQPFDNITTPGTNNDNSGNFQRFDYCGTYRAQSPYSFMRGQCRGSYFGGAQVRIDGDGDRHLVKESDIRTHMLQREELLLESTGEPFVLIRRMWTGARCPCVMLRREHPDARCPLCFSSGFLQGFVQFFNPRRSDRRILVRIDPAADDLNIVDRGGLEPAYEPTAWTMAFPALKDRDILVRFNPDNTQEFIYEVLDVTRVRATFAQTGAQKFRMKRLPKTDILNQFPILRDAGPRPGTLETSQSSASGLVLHSHQIVVPESVNLLTYNVATLVSEGHNHIIVNGVIQQVIGHTHTITM